MVAFAVNKKGPRLPAFEALAMVPVTGTRRYIRWMLRHNRTQQPYAGYGGFNCSSPARRAVFDCEAVTETEPLRHGDRMHAAGQRMRRPLAAVLISGARTRLPAQPHRPPLGRPLDVLRVHDHLRLPP